MLRRAGGHVVGVYQKQPGSITGEAGAWRSREDWTQTPSSSSVLFEIEGCHVGGNETELPLGGTVPFTSHRIGCMRFQ